MSKYWVKSLTCGTPNCNTIICNTLCRHVLQTLHDNEGVDGRADKEGEGGDGSWGKAGI